MREPYTFENLAVTFGTWEIVRDSLRYDGSRYWAAYLNWNKNRRPIEKGKKNVVIRRRR